MKKFIILLIAFISLIFTGCTKTKVSAQIVSDEMMQPRLISIDGSLEEVSKECLSSVVAISSSDGYSQSVGSGVCVSGSGHIITNYHVVEGGKNIYLYLANGEICSAKLLWKDNALDLAILKSQTLIPYLKIADENDLSLGEEVIAIGTPIDLNFKHTITKGVLSALNRTVVVDDEDGYSSLNNLIQHDASINPGNSGGPLINKNGEIIGINTVKVQDAEGIGFAISCSTITPVLENFINNNSHSNGFLGVFGYDVSLDNFDSKEKGLKIVDLTENSPLNEFEISAGDVILSIDGKEVLSYNSLKKELYKKQINQEVSLDILTNGEIKNFKVKLIKNNI